MLVILARVVLPGPKAELAQGLGCQQKYQVPAKQYFSKKQNQKGKINSEASVRDHNKVKFQFCFQSKLEHKFSTTLFTTNSVITDFRASVQVRKLF